MAFRFRGRMSLAADFVLDFTGGAVPSGVSGAGGNGSRVNAAGLIAPASAPRLTYAPTGPYGPLGVLIEPAATNLCFPSAGGFIASNNATVTNNNAAGVDGAMTAGTIADNATMGSHLVNAPNNASATAGQSYTDSVAIKAGTASLVQIVFGSAAFGTTAYANFDLSAGTVTALGAAATATIRRGPNGFWICTITATATVTAASALAIAMITSATAGRAQSYIGLGSTLIVGYGEIKPGAIPNDTYIPTTSAAVTRAADAVSFTIPAGFSSLTYTFDDLSTQTVAVAPGPYTIPTTLNRPIIRKIVGSA